MNHKLSIKHTTHYIYELVNRIIIAIYYFPNVIKLLLWGIKFSKNIKFDGLIHIRKLPNSQIEIGKGCYFSNKSRFNLIGINHSCIISTQTREAVVEIGENCGFSGTVIGAFKKIQIGNNVKCGANSTITDGDWHLDDPRSASPREIQIGNNVWIGANCIVLKGVTIGANSLIGANSVVTKSIPPNVIAAGNPCKIIRKI